MKILADRISSIIFLLSASVFAPHLCGATVDSGSINLPKPFSFRRFSLSGTGFAVDGSFDLGNWSVESCTPCELGSSVSVNGVVSGNDFGDGSATIGGIVTDEAIWGDLSAAGPSLFEVTGPPILLNHGGGTYTSTFSFKGELCGTVPGTVPVFPSGQHPCTINLTGLTGSGHVSVDIVLVSLPGRDILSYTGATYTFETVLSGVPEPSTIVLVASTAVMIFLGRRKMRPHY